MSQNRLSVVGLDASGAKADELAAGALEWLLASGVIAANAARDAHPLMSEWTPGPAWRTLVRDDVLRDPRSQRWFEVFETSTLPGVDVVAQRAFYHRSRLTSRPSADDAGRACRDLHRLARAEGEFIDALRLRLGRRSAVVRAHL